MPRRLLKFSADFLIRLRREPVLTALLLIVAGSLWAFVELADEVLDRDTHQLDAAILLSMREAGDTSEPIGPPRLKEAARDLTALGGLTVLAGLSVASMGVALLLGRPRLALLIGVAVVGGALLSTALKRGFDRPRPDLVSHQAEVMSKSFPSGHSMMSAIVYLTLGLLLARALPRRSMKFYVVGLSVILTLSVGASRVYLGVHWPTDVLGGWTLGAAWALLFWLIALRIEPGHQVAIRAAAAEGQR